MKILIIGGTGFISSILTKKLLEKHCEVTILTRGKTKINFEVTEKFNLCNWR